MYNLVLGEVRLFIVFNSFKINYKLKFDELVYFFGFGGYR